MKHISEVQKHDAFIKYICGYSPQELANELNVHFTTVYRWVRAWQKDLLYCKLTDLSIQDIGATRKSIFSINAYTGPAAPSARNFSPTQPEGSPTPRK